MIFLKIIIEGVVGNSYLGDIAVDDFSFRTGNCAVVPADADPTVTQSSTGKPTTTTVIKPTSGTLIKLKLLWCY